MKKKHVLVEGLKKVMNCELIKNIDIENLASWKDKIFLTFDMDWCSDKVLEYTLDFLEKYDVNVTFFVTHETKLLERIRKNKNFELGIHPNFNFLLQGDFRYGKNIPEIIKYYLDIIPEAKSARSHSMTQSTPILETFEQFGLSFDCNTFIPYSTNINLKPFKHWTGGLIRLPYFWEDDIHYIYGWNWDVEKFLNYPGLKVFDFHPIHVFLNAENLERYNEAKPFLNDYKKLKGFVNNETYGTRDFLIDLIKGIKEK